MWWPFAYRKTVANAYVVKLVSSETDESETLGVFTDSESAWDYSHEIAKNYNRFEWYISIEEFTVNKPRDPVSPPNDLDIVYPCPIEWEN